MAYENIVFEKDGAVGTLTVNRPKSLNALNPATVQEIAACLEQLRGDASVRCLIITGAGERAFVAGADISAMVNMTPLEGKAFASSGLNVGRTLEELPVPVIAAVNGFALGGGFEMALACDIIIAADHARLGLPEPRVGLAAAAGGVHRLPRQIPLKIAMGYLLTGKHMTAQEAHALGIVNEVVPLKDLMPTAHRWAGEILECAPLSVRATKQCAMQGLGRPLAQALDDSYPALKQMFSSEDVKEGPRAFAEKRKPNWQAR